MNTEAQDYFNAVPENYKPETQVCKCNIDNMVIKWRGLSFKGYAAQDIKDFFALLAMSETNIFEWIDASVSKLLECYRCKLFVVQDNAAIMASANGGLIK